MVDDYAGSEISVVLDTITQRKSNETVFGMLMLGILAGMYISFGAVAATTVLSCAETPTVLSKWLAASVFCVGLVLVIVPGSELFTGNILMSAGLVSGKVPVRRVLRNWVFVYVGNFLGAALLAFAIKGAAFFGTPDEPTRFADTAIDIAAAKTALGWSVAFFRGMLCNMLVCLAVMLAVAARTVQGKVLGIYLPIIVFVLSGFEHSIANMYFIPAGLIAKGAFFSEFFTIFKNLIPVTAGNIFGGILLILLHPARARQLLRKLLHKVSREV